MSTRPVTEAAWSTDEDQRLAAAMSDADQWLAATMSDAEVTEPVLPAPGKKKNRRSRKNRYAPQADEGNLSGGRDGGKIEQDTGESRERTLPQGASLQPQPRNETNAVVPKMLASAKARPPPEKCSSCNRRKPQCGYPINGLTCVECQAAGVPTLEPPTGSCCDGANDGAINCPTYQGEKAVSKSKQKRDKKKKKKEAVLVEADNDKEAAA